VDQPGQRRGMAHGMCQQQGTAQAHAAAHRTGGLRHPLHKA